MADVQLNRRAAHLQLKSHDENMKALADVQLLGLTLSTKHATLGQRLSFLSTEHDRINCHEDAKIREGEGDGRHTLWLISWVRLFVLFRIEQGLPLV